MSECSKVCFRCVTSRDVWNQNEKTPFVCQYFQFRVVDTASGSVDNQISSVTFTAVLWQGLGISRVI